MLLKTSLASRYWFLILLLLSQWSIILGCDAVTVLAVLITVEAILIVADLYHARQERADNAYHTHDNLS